MVIGGLFMPLLNNQWLESIFQLKITKKVDFFIVYRFCFVTHHQQVYCLSICTYLSMSFCVHVSQHLPLSLSICLSGLVPVT